MNNKKLLAMSIVTATGLGVMGGSTELSAATGDFNIDVGEALITSIDGSDTVINPDGSYTIDVTVEGENLTSLDKNDYRVYADPHFNYPADYEEISDTETHLTKVWQPSAIDRDWGLQLVVGYESEDETFVDIPAPDLEEMQVQVGSHMSVDYKDAEENLHIDGYDVTPVIESVDGSRSVVNSDGSVDVVIVVTGQNLNQTGASNFKIKAGPYKNRVDDFKLEGEDLVITKTFDQDDLALRDYPISLVSFDGTADETTTVVTADAETADEQLVDDIISYITVDAESNALSVGSKKDQSTINTIDGSRSKVNSDGSIDVIIDVNGEDLKTLTNH